MPLFCWEAQAGPIRQCRCLWDLASILLQWHVHSRDCLAVFLQAQESLPAGDPETKDDVEADTSGDETDPVDPGHKARDEMFAAVASIRVGY